MFSLSLIKVLIDAHGNSDNTFRVGNKILTILCQLQVKTKLKPAFVVIQSSESSSFNTKKLCLLLYFSLQLFKTWFKFCLDFDQAFTTKSAITYYGAMFAKTLMAEVSLIG